MPASYYDKEVKCPFYTTVLVNKNRKEPRISCEGVKGAHHTYVSFKTNDDLDAYLRKHCASNYEACLVCKMLNGMYK